MTADSERTQHDIDATSDHDWFEVLAGRRPPGPGNTSESRAARLNGALNAVYEAEQSQQGVTKAVNQAPGKKAATTRRRRRHSRWFEYPAVAAVAALAGFLVGQVIDGSREVSEPNWEMVDPTTRYRVHSSPEAGVVPMPATRSPASSEFPTIGWAPQGQIKGLDGLDLKYPKVPFSGSAPNPGFVSGAYLRELVERPPKVHFGVIEPTSEFVNSEFLREFLVGQGVQPGTVSPPPDGAALTTFHIPTGPSDTLRGAMSAWQVDGDAGDVVVLMLVGQAVD